MVRVTVLYGMQSMNDMLWPYGHLLVAMTGSSNVSRHCRSDWNVHDFTIVSYDLEPDFTQISVKKVYGGNERTDSRTVNGWPLALRMLVK